MADVREMRIFAPEQIEVHQDLPSILKNYSKEVIRNGPEDIISFSRQYFEAMLKTQGYSFEHQKAKTEVTASESLFVWRDRTQKINDHYSIMNEKTESGSKRKVRVAIHKKSGIERTVVQKSYKAGTHEREELRKHITELVARFDHPGIAKYIEVFEDENNVYIVIESLKGDNIIDNLWKQGSNNEGAAAHMIQQVLHAVEYLHSKGVAHNQLNPSQIVHVNPGSTTSVKVIDFDQVGAEVIVKDFDSFLGDLKRDQAAYVAPELIQGKWHIQNDEWSIGVLMYYLLVGNPPFWADTYKDIFKQITNFRFDQQSDRWNNISIEGRDLIQRLLTFSPQERITAGEALSHPWFKKAGRGEHNHRDLGDALSTLKGFHTGSRLKQSIHSYFVRNLLSTTEMKTLAEQFRALDKLGGGRLSKDDIIDGYRHVRGIDFSVKEIQDLIDKVDLDGSGAIDYNEFLQGALSSERVLSELRLDNAFKIYDVHGNSSISVSEIKAMLESYKDVDESIVTKALGEVAKTASGKGLSFHDFKILIKNVFKH